MTTPATKPKHAGEAMATDGQSELAPSLVPNAIVQTAIGMTLIASIYSSWISGQLPDFAAWSSTLSLVIALCSALFVSPRVFRVGYLISLLFFVIAWRVAAMNSVTLMEWVAGIAFLPFLAQFAEVIVRAWQRARLSGHVSATVLSWQMTTIRMVFGLNELGHATEKIFAGEASFHTLVKGFQGFGLGHAAALFVIVGGLTEFASAVSVGLGFFARLGALMSVVYFLVATVGFGHEWTRGYEWSTNGGGGWEYVMLILVVFSAVLLGGAGKFSIDSWLLQRGLIPKKLTWVSVPRGLR